MAYIFKKEVREGVKKKTKNQNRTFEYLDNDSETDDGDFRVH